MRSEASKRRWNWARASLGKCDKARSGEGSRPARHAIDAIDAVRPGELAAGDVEFPAADLGEALGLRQQRLAPPQLAALVLQQVLAGAAMLELALGAAGRLVQADLVGDDRRQMAHDLGLARRQLARLRPEDAQRADIEAGPHRDRSAGIEADMRRAGDIGIVAEARIGGGVGHDEDVVGQDGPGAEGSSREVPSMARPMPEVALNHCRSRSTMPTQADVAPSASQAMAQMPSMDGAGQALRMSRA